jgi:predicted nucleotidyltransferase
VALDKAISEAAGDTGMRMLVLFGSRARDRVHMHSDWDFGYLSGEHGDIDLLRTRLAQILATDAIDLVNLARGGALLRMQVGAEGKPLFESEPGLFVRYQDEVARTWCDVEPVLSLAYARILEEARFRVSPQSSALLSEKIAAVDRHLRRVADRLPQSPSELEPMTDTSDAVILHLWQAAQVVIDLAVSSCVRMGLGHGSRTARRPSRRSPRFG